MKILNSAIDTSNWQLISIALKGGSFRLALQMGSLSEIPPFYSETYLRLLGILLKESIAGEKTSSPQAACFYLYEKLTMGKGLYLFVDQSFGTTLNLMLNRHQLLPPLRVESNR